MNSLKKLLIVSSLLGSLAVQAGAVQYLPGQYAVDPMHSKIGFEVPHLVISTVEGRFSIVEGTIKLEKDFLKSQVTAKAETASIDTGVKDRDEHLKSADFFDAKNNPQLQFQSLSIKGKPESFQITGDLTIKNVTKKVTFEGRYLGNVKDGYGNEKAAFTATTEINRKDFGLTWNNVVEAGPVVGDKVKIELNIQGVRAKDTKATSK